MTLRTHYLQHHSGFVLIREWQPNQQPNGVIHLFHGMMEYTGIYHHWAKKLTAMGWAVVAHDQPASGYTVESECDQNVLPKNGKNKLIHCAILVDEWIRNQYKDQPLVRYGHSMGAFVVLNLNLCSDDIDGVILTGLLYQNKWALIIQHLFLRMLTLLLGQRKPAKLAHYITFNSLNRHFKNKKSGFEWVSRNKDLLYQYLKDPFCGNIVSWGYFCTLNELLLTMHQPKVYQSLKRCLILTGENDPLSYGGKRLKPIENALLHAQINFNHHVIPQAYHKIEHDPDENVSLDLIEGFLKKL